LQYGALLRYINTLQFCTRDSKRTAPNDPPRMQHAKLASIVPVQLRK
jgi:hypothetical protein